MTTLNLFTETPYLQALLASQSGEDLVRSIYFNRVDLNQLDVPFETYAHFYNPQTPKRAKLLISVEIGLHLIKTIYHFSLSLLMSIPLVPTVLQKKFGRENSYLQTALNETCARVTFIFNNKRGQWLLDRSKFRQDFSKIKAVSIPQFDQEFKFERFREAVELYDTTGLFERLKTKHMLYPTAEGFKFLEDDELLQVSFNDFKCNQSLSNKQFIACLARLRSIGETLVPNKPAPENLDDLTLGTIIQLQPEELLKTDKKMRNQGDLFIMATKKQILLLGLQRLNSNQLENCFFNKQISDNLSDFNQSPRKTSIRP